MIGIPNLTFARQTHQLEAIVLFYKEGLGFSELSRQEAGTQLMSVTLGKADAPYCLKFSQAVRPESALGVQDTVLVFAMEGASVWTAAVMRMRGYGYRPLNAREDSTEEVAFLDPDGYRVVIKKLSDQIRLVA